MTNPHIKADVSAVTPAQRAQILREEAMWMREGWLEGNYDGGIKDLMLSIQTRVEELEGAE